MSSNNLNYNSTQIYFKSNVNYFRGAIIFLILFNKKMPNEYLQFCQSTGGKILFAISIAFLVSFDTLLGMLLTVYYLFIMNEYNIRFKTKTDKFLNLNNEFNKYKKFREMKKEPTCRNNFNL